MPKALLTFLLTALCGLCFVAVAQADPAAYAGASSDGSKVFFTTTAKLVPGDTDNGFADIYERFEDSAKGAFVTREISTGPTGGNDSYGVTFDGVSTDGTKAFFSTAESLVAEDKDHAADVYMRNTSTGVTTLVSQGAASCAPACGSGAFPVAFVGASSSGSKVFFITNERLGEGDGDEAGDIYVRDLGTAPATTSLVSRPDPICAGCTASASVSLPVIEGKPSISEEGTKVVFESTDKLAEGDGDSEKDIYERDLTTGKTALVSVPGTCTLAPASLCEPIYRGLSADGTRVFIQTRAQLAPGDEDNRQDVYEWSAASEPPTRVSVGAGAENGNGNFDAVFAGASADGSKVFFETAEKLSGEDGDAATDVYERVPGETKLASPGTAHAAEFNRASSGGGTVLFSTIDALAGGDSGEMKDVYAWTGGTPSLTSAGNPSFESSFAGASQDASKVFYTTTAKLSSADKDEKPDIYQGPGTPVLVSTGPLADKGLDTPHLAGVSVDGAHAFFTTTERLTVDDNFAGEQDVYDRSAGGTLLVSVGSELELGPPAPGLTGTNPASPGASTEPTVLGEAEPGSAIKLYATPDCSGAPVGIGTAAEAGDPAPGTFGIAVAVAAGSTTTLRATATNKSGDGSGCSASAVTYRQESAAAPPPSGGGASGGSGGGGGSIGGTGGSTGGTGGSSGGSGGSGGGIKIGGIVYVAPITRITFGPASKTRSRRPVFRFIDATEQPGTTFVCKVDRHAWKGCGSPFKLPRLKPGRHVFAVKGRSAAGQWEQKPVTRKLKVVR